MFCEGLADLLGDADVRLEELQRSILKMEWRSGWNGSAAQRNLGKYIAYLPYKV
jgi:hypothetical protein